MSYLAFRADPPAEPGNPFADFDRMDAEMEGGTDHIKVTTKSGRLFRYEASKYQFGPGLTPAQARSLALSIAHEKYRAADWDWQHSNKQAIEEISESLYDIIMGCVANMRENKSG